VSAKWVGRAILAALALLFALRIVQLKGKGLLHVATPRGSQAPSVAGPLLDGGRFALAGERGHAVALVFWAPWCGPCRAELPGVERVWKQLGAAPHTARIVAVDTEGDPATAKEAQAKLGLTMPIVLDDGSASAAYQVTMIPQTVIVDAGGKVAALIRGEASEDELMRAIERVEKP
jgi:cytochrome c biogenesis protein CcmG/thiol:disulfide interchange protein DsbE